MGRLSCMSIVWMALLILVSSIVYTYFIKHQPHAPLLSAIKSKDFTHFSSQLELALSALPRHSPASSIHFGDGRSVTHAVAMHGTVAMLDHIHERGFPVDPTSPSDLRTPLHVAALYNSEAFLLRLLSLLPPDSPIDPVASNGFTPLLYAILFSRHENAKLLLERGADPNARVGSGMSALQMAVIYSKDRMVEQLLDYGGSIGDHESYYTDVQRVIKRSALRKQREAQKEDEEGSDPEVREDVQEIGQLGVAGSKEKGLQWDEQALLMDGGQSSEWE